MRDNRFRKCVGLKEIPAIEAIDPNLTLKGLKLIYDLNRSTG